MRAVFAERRKTGALDLEAVEQAARDALHRAGAALLETLLSQPEAAEPHLPCACGARARCAGRRPKTIVTVLGEVVLQRPCYHCARCGQGFAPRDRALDVEAAVAAREQAEIDRAIQLDLPETGGPAIPILYVEMDGTGVPATAAAARTREVKLGCVFTQSRRDARGRPARDADSTSCTGAIEDAAAFGRRLYAEAWRRGWSRARKRVILGDGAAWIWNLSHEYFPGAVEIVDRYHAREHLWELAGKLFPNQDERRRDWARRLLKKLDAGRIEPLVKAL